MTISPSIIPTVLHKYSDILCRDVIDTPLMVLVRPALDTKIQDYVSNAHAIQKTSTTGLFLVPSWKSINSVLWHHGLPPVCDDLEYRAVFQHVFDDTDDNTPSNLKKLLNGNVLKASKIDDDTFINKTPFEVHLWDDFLEFRHKHMSFMVIPDNELDTVYHNHNQATRFAKANYLEYIALLSFFIP